MADEHDDDYEVYAHGIPRAYTEKRMCTHR